MWFRLPLDESTHEWLAAEAQRTNQSVERVAIQALQAQRRLYQQVTPGTRTLLLDGPVLEALEVILGGGSVLHAADLQRKVERLAGISYGHVRLPFTPGMLEEIQSRAERLGLTPEELTRRTAEKLYELFFTHLGVGSQG